jgi:hypothetical protein
MTDYVNYEDTITNDFILKFREKYEIEPDKYAYLAYDIAQFFLSSIDKYGHQFPQCINNIDYHFVSDTYNFKFNNVSKSYDNSHLTFLKYVDFVIQEDN